MAESVQKITDLIQGSDKILIGIGEEFSCEEIELSRSSVYKRYLEKKKQDDLDEAEWLLECIRNHYIHSEVNLEQLDIFKAYKKLFSMVKDKDYYIVSMNYDSLLENAGFLPEKIVYPCGNKKNYQCIENCQNQVWGNAESEKQIIQLILKEDTKLSEIKRPVCANCGKLAVYNKVGAAKYCETGYLEQWEQYTEWTSHTLNKKLSIIELGVSFKYPTVIRWPFEKIAFINNKAHFVRVNKKFSQVSEELEDKVIAVKESSVDFLLK